MKCPICGSANRAQARFCYSCAAPLPPRPTADDQRWLAATLVAEASSFPRQTTAAAPSGQGLMMSDLLGDRYELLGELESGQAELLDTKPWLRCWSCGATDSEAAATYCGRCGAHLELRRYLAERTPRETPAGAALIARIDDEAALRMLPAVWDSVDSDTTRFTLLAPHERQRPTLPLDESTALRVGRNFAVLAAALHARGLALGSLPLEDLDLNAAGVPRLSTARGLHVDPAGAAVAEDLRRLAHLIEELTATPRVTQRLDEEQASAALATTPLAGLLRDLRTGQVPDARTLGQRLDDMIAERTPLVALRAAVGAASDVGVVRDHNEDSMLVLDLRLNQNAQDRTWGLYIVADGMGGHAAGEVASDLAIRGAAETVLAEFLAPTLGGDYTGDEAALQELLRKAVQRANQYVLGEASSRGNDMGTTITLALTIGNQAYVANVGDSRTYLLRQGELRRVSKDHSLVMRLVDLGQISDEEIYSHPQRNAVLRSLGDRPDVEVDLFVEKLRPGDMLLLCSDGQWEMTRDAEMARIIAESTSPQAAADTLVAAANTAGGEDNITAIVVQFAS